MSIDGEKKLDEARQHQPLKELERKWNKAKGRHSNAFWTQEWIDLAMARGARLAKFFKKLPEAP